jgi:hypothetical protein
LMLRVVCDSLTKMQAKRVKKSVRRIPGPIANHSHIRLRVHCLIVVV